MFACLSKRTTALALLVAISLPGRAETVVIDFDPLYVASSDLGVISVASPYVEDGFQITGPNLGTIPAYRTSGEPRVSFQGSAGLFSQNRGALVLTRVDAQPFNLLSVDYAHSNNPAIAKTFTVTGLTVDGQTVSQSIALITGPDNVSASSFPGYLTMVLDSSFSNLQSVSFGVIATFSSIVVDNINLSSVTAVPEPQSYALMLLGVGALLLAQRRRPR